MGRKRGGPGGAPRGWEEVKAPTVIGRQRASNPIRQNGPRVGGNKEANAGAGCAGGRALSADWLSEREAWGTCRREPREWRAGDVSAPCPLRHLAPSPPNASAFAYLQ